MFPIKTIMTTNVITVSPDTSIFEALDIITRNRISGVPVVSVLGQVVGILTEKDLLRVLVEKNVDVNSKVEDYMSREVICFTEEDSAFEVCRFFMRTHIRRVPIVRGNMLVGIVSRRDIIALTAEARSKMSQLRYA